MNAISQAWGTAEGDVNWIDVGHVDDVPMRGSRVIATGAGDIALFKTADAAVFALKDRCPHKGGPLSQGIVHDRGVTCPLHNWVISLETGEAQGADTGCTPRIALKVEDGRILISGEAIARMVG
jgi:nitrite reductase (NADH) small subunit